MDYWELSGKPLLVRPQCDLRVSGNKVWSADRILQLPGQQKLEALWDVKGRRAADSWEREHVAAIQGLPSTRSIKWTWCFPESAISEEWAISGLKEAPRDLRVTTMYLFPASECRKGKWEGGWTEGVCSTCRACFGVWEAKNTITTSSWRLKMWFRNRTIYQTEAKDRSKYAV